jgi:hypothetical protein
MRDDALRASLCGEYREALAVAERGEEVAAKLMDPAARSLASFVGG